MTSTTAHRIAGRRLPGRGNHAATNVFWLSTVAIFCQPSILRNLIWPVATRLKSSTPAASLLGNEPCVFTRRLNSSWTWALLVGHFVARFALNRVRSHIVARRTAAGDSSTPSWRIGIGVPPRLTGFTERLFFTTAVAFELSGVATAMMARIGIKMAADWNRPPNPAGPPPDPAGALSAALGGLVSTFFALTGGVICRSLRF